MKSITLINPEIAQRIFISNNWTNESEYFINIEGLTSETMCSYSVSHSNLSGEKIKISFGEIYNIPLDEFGDNIILELKEVENLGVLLTINQLPIFLRVYNDAPEENTSEIAKLYPTLRIVDLYGNDLIKNLSGIALCLNLEILRVDCCYELSNLSALSNFSKLNFLGLCVLPKLHDYRPVSKLTNLKQLKIIDDLTDLHFISNLTSLNTLILSLDKIKNINPISNLTNLTDLELYIPQASDLKSVSALHRLKSLRIFSKNLRSIQPISKLNNLEFLELCLHESEIDINPISNLINLQFLNLSGNRSLTDVSSISNLIKLEHIDLSGCYSLINLKPLAKLNQLKILKLDFCVSLTDLTFISSLHSISYLSLGGCELLSSLLPLQNLLSLSYLNLQNCKRITIVKPISKLPNLKELFLWETENIRDFNTLINLIKLEKLEWINKLSCSEVLIQSAFKRMDIQYVEDKWQEWISEIEISKDSSNFIINLLNNIKLFDVKIDKCLNIIMPMRTRGLQSEERNDLDAYTWETWCNLALNLDKADAIACLQAAVNELNIERETEVILGPVIIASSEIIERHPKEKELILAWVNEQLQLLENHPEEQRQIAPSAAVFFASLNQKDDVLFWLQKATDAKVPLWRERVLNALVKYYAKKENFIEARRLLDEMQVQNEKDQAIAALAQAMAASHPVEAGFLLDEMQEASISSEAARQLLQHPSILSAPQGIYQVLLHLQSNPDELASALEMILERDTVGSIAEAVKQLFIQTQAIGPSAAVMLELCKHPSIADFVKPRALEKYKSELQERANRELSQSVPHLIAEMQNATLLAEDEAQELTTLMQTS